MNYPLFGKNAKNKKKKITQYEIPGVIVRGTEAHPTNQQTGRHQKAAVKPRKDMRLRNSNGAVITLPSIPQVHLGWRLLSLIIACGLGIGLYVLWTAPLLQVKDLDISGLVRIPKNVMFDFLQIEGKPSFTLAPAVITKALQENYPEFSSVSVNVGFPNHVAISVTERIPVIAWQLPDHTLLVDKNGILFSLRPNQEIGVIPVIQASELPLGYEQSVVISDTNQLAQGNTQKSEGTENIVGVSTKKPLSQETIDAVLSLFEQAPQDSPILYSREHGFGWRDSGGWEVYFGNAQDMTMKLRVYHALLKLLDSKDIRPALVSVEWVDAPYYRLEP